MVRPDRGGHRHRVQGFIEELLEYEFTGALGGRSKHERAVDHHQGYRNGTRERQLSGSFGAVSLSVPRAGLGEDACFINVSRGSLVDEAALQAGRIAGAALDVGRAPDQMPTPRLAALPNVVATPHVGGLTRPAIEAQTLETVQQAAAILRGRPPPGAVNIEAWTRRP